MFSAGDIVFVESDQATGYKKRNKYHLCVCGARGKYFFINSKSWEGSFEIFQSDFNFLTKASSFVACNTLLSVGDEYMISKGARIVGNLPPDIAKRLVDHIDQCDVLSEEEKDIAVDGLSVLF